MINKKTLLALKKKSNVKYGESARMPNLNKVSELLKEVGVVNFMMEWSEYKYTSAAGLRYTTGGGTKEYNGYRLQVPEIGMNINSTDTYYSWNNQRYAKELVELVESKI